ncbi:MAG: FIST C-terminal domain-containing protein [Planctomycetes bacterium]|nr:FIST C-terminal domain-containing protein [Planctomycetota bacterium]
MKIVSAIATEPDADQAADHLLDEVRPDLAGERPDLAVLFVSGHPQEALARAAGRVRSTLGAATLVGCTGQGVIGGDLEVERKPALSLLAARFPGARVHPFRMVCRQEGDEFVYDGWPDPGEIRDPRAFLLFVDPFSNVPEIVLSGLAARFGPVPIAGGMSSGGTSPGANFLFLDDRAYRFGLAGVALAGDLAVRTVVSQGCRPIGRHFVVTEAKENVIYKIGGKPALAKFEEIYRELPHPEQELARRALHVGRVMNEYQETFQRGDFLIRNCEGFDSESGAIVISDRVRVGQTLQFHVRDRAAASEDLHALLRAEGAGKGVAGGLLFTCNGRGRRLFGVPSHDARAVREELGKLPLAGFFAGGEIGPVAGKAYLHGYTASLALFAPAARTE